MGDFCRNIPSESIAGHENLREFYRGLNLPGGPASSTDEINLEPLLDETAIACFRQLIQSNPRLLTSLERTEAAVHALRTIDPSDPDRVTWNELRYLYGSDAATVAEMINAAIGLVRFTTESGHETNWWINIGAALGTFGALAGLGYLIARPRPPAPLPPDVIPEGPVLEVAPRRLQQEPPVSEPSPAAPPEAPVEVPHERHPEVITLPAPTVPGQALRVLLGRHGAGGNFVQVPASEEDLARPLISRSHAEILIEVDGRVFIRDLGSLNGSWIYREDPVAGLCGEDQVGDRFVRIRDGEVVRFSSIYYRVRIEGAQVRLERALLEVPAERPEGELPRAEIGRTERSLIERLREAQASGREVEVFIRESKEKYAGTIVRIIEEGEGAVVRLRVNGYSLNFPIEEILTIRGRGPDDNLTSRYSRVPNPQYPDKSINRSGIYGDRMVVLADFADPRLTDFLERHMRSIRDRLARGEISQQEAAEQAWRMVREKVPYDDPRGVYGIKDMPHHLYRLGDFIETGVCNERGMLLQVSLQYIGVESQMEKGPFMGGRHAWVRAFPTGRGGEAVELVLDPQDVMQTGRPIDVAREPYAAAPYRDDNVRFAREAMMTIFVSAQDGAEPTSSGRETHIMPVVRTGLEEVLTYPVSDRAVYDSLAGVDPGLARYYRDNLSPTAQRISTMAELVAAMDPPLVDEALRSATLSGRPVPQVPERFVFEMVARSAEGRGSFSDGDPTARERMATQFEREMGSRRGIERTEGRPEVDPAERERLERERRRAPVEVRP